MSAVRDRDRALALAGVAQFALNAHHLATDGRDRSTDMDAALRTVFCTDPKDAEDAVGGAANVAEGIAFLRRQIGRDRTRPGDAQVARYLGQILRLAGRLQARASALAALRGAIDRAQSLEPAQAPAILAAAYRGNISGLSPQIMMRGHPSYLNNPALAERIRTHLLAAVRCGVLWRQCGGRFWNLLLGRARLMKALAEFAE